MSLKEQIKPSSRHPEPQSARRESPPGQPNFFAALALLALIVFMIVYGIVAVGYPTELVLISAGVLATLFARLHGIRWDDVVAIMADKIRTALTALLVLYTIGLIIGTWMICGTIPYFIYYGLKLIDPHYLYIMAFISTAIVSTCIGTSWGSAGTIGVAIVGIAAAMNVNMAITAGAVISGAYFGDKLSPLSDTTIMASMVARVDLYRHIRHLMFTSVPSCLIAGLVYLLLGLNMDANVGKSAAITETTQQLEQLFHLGPLLILPALIILGGSLWKKPTLVVMFAAALCATLIALFVQHMPLGLIARSGVAGFKVDMLHAMRPNLQTDKLNEALVTLLNRGGIYSMQNAVLFAFCAFFFASALEASGILRVVLDRTLEYVRSATATILASLAAAACVILATANSYVTFFLIRELFAEQYNKTKLHPLNLSRSMEDGGMIPEPLAPWTVSAVYMATTLGVSTLDYAPWALFNYLGIVFSALLAIIGPWTGWYGIKSATAMSRSDVSSFVSDETTAS